MISCSACGDPASKIFGKRPLCDDCYSELANGDISGAVGHIIDSGNRQHRAAIEADLVAQVGMRVEERV